jgi:hypothetical protein
MKDKKRINLARESGGVRRTARRLVAGPQPTRLPLQLIRDRTPIPSSFEQEGTKETKKRELCLLRSDQLVHLFAPARMSRWMPSVTFIS